MALPLQSEVPADLLLEDNSTLEYDAPAFVPDASANVADGAATTAQLTAPTGKTSGADFQAGTFEETSSDAAALDLAANKYTELEWSLLTDADVVDADEYEFRITVQGTALDTYAVTPTLTIGSASAPQTVTATAGLITVTAGTAATVVGPVIAQATAATITVSGGTASVAQRIAASSAPIIVTGGTTSTAQRVIATSATISVSAGTADRIVGGVTSTATAAVIIVTAGNAVLALVVPASSATITITASPVPALVLTIPVLAPIVVVSAGDAGSVVSGGVTAATAGTVAVTGGSAAAFAVQSATAGLVAVTAGIAGRTVGALAVLATAGVVDVTAGEPPTVEGGVQDIEAPWEEWKRRRFRRLHGPARTFPVQTLDVFFVFGARFDVGEITRYTETQVLRIGWNVAFTFDVAGASTRVLDFSLASTLHVQAAQPRSIPRTHALVALGAEFGHAFTVDAIRRGHVDDADVLELIAMGEL